MEKVAWKIFEKHADKQHSFTDCTSLALMQAETVRTAFTFDEHFAQFGFATVP
jgi:predicted nucleic acid-binding protein